MLNESHVHNVTVYGSLLKGFGNHDLLRVAKFLGECTFKGTMYSLRAYPACSSNGDDTIKGEMYEVDDLTLRRLDGLEGHPSFYKREVLETSLGPAWIYLINNREFSPEQHVKCGSWREFCEKRGEVW